MQIFTGGIIRTMDPTRPVVEALAVDEGRIVARGCAHDVRSRFARAEQDTEELDIGTGCLCPGFIDAHHHISLATLFADAVHLGKAFGDHEASSVGEILERLRRRAAATAPGRWVLADGYDEASLAERRAPTLAELDASCPDHPVLAMHFSFHEALANSRAFELMGWGPHEPNPPQGTIERDRRGRPTGHLIEEAASMVQCRALDDTIAIDEPGYLTAFGEHQRKLFATGIVRVFDPGVHPALEQTLQRGVASGVIRVGLNLMVVGPRGILTPPAERLDGTITGEGDGALRIGPLKLFMDGGKLLGARITVGEALRSALAAGRHALRHRNLDGFRVGNDTKLRLGRDLRLHGGWLFYRADEARGLAERAVARGFAVACHAIGNEAIDRALEALPPTPGQRAAGVGPNRIEHFVMPEPGHVGRAAAAGLAIAAQPAFVPMLAERVQAIGYPQPDRLLPLRDMLDAGLCVAGSSDAPVDDFAPLRAMWCATSRLAPNGEVIGPGQRVLPEEALTMYTTAAAEAGGIAAECGSLTEGKRADLVWLADDPLRPGVLAERGPRVLGTWVAGERVYAA